MRHFLARALRSLAQRLDPPTQPFRLANPGEDVLLRTDAGHNVVLHLDGAKFAWPADRYRRSG